MLEKISKKWETKLTASSPREDIVDKSGGPTEGIPEICY
jgi:hypothetical protein